MEYYLYVSGTAAGRLARFLMDGSSGRLQPQESIETPAPVGPMAIDRAGKFLFAATGGERPLGSFAIDSASGDLEPVNAVAVDCRPC